MGFGALASFGAQIAGPVAGVAGSRRKPSQAKHHHRKESELSMPASKDNDDRCLPGAGSLAPRLQGKKSGLSVVKASATEQVK